MGGASGVEGAGHSALREEEPGGVNVPFSSRGDRGGDEEESIASDDSPVWAGELAWQRKG